jgi:hypothetical protein
MSHLIHIKDLVNNTEFIYSPIVNLENGFHKFFESLSNHQQLKCNQTDTFCEIFREDEVTNAGWVWNSKETKRETLYILTLIPVYTNISVNTNTISTQTQTNDNLSNMYSKNDFNFMDFTNDNNWQQKSFAPPTYIKHKFWSEELINELKEKLTLPNFGLHHNFF